MKSIRTNPTIHAVQGDERIRTAVTRYSDFKRYESGPLTTASPHCPAQDAGKRHGRGCACTPCRAEDWDAVERGIREAQDAGKRAAA